tara:strand:+ start:1670 stop:1999 length:330 start_codon:yes stop_codon:yes gene_type:complete
MRERRQNERVGVSFPVECRTLPSKNYFYTVSKDLSANGARIVSNEFLAKNNELKLNINLIDKVLNIKARVSWCNKERSAERFSTGLEFLELTEPNKKTLSAFLNKIVNS